MLEYVSGVEIENILADLNHVYEDNQMDVDGTILFDAQKMLKELFVQVRLPQVKRIVL